jgi:membrane protein YdbS with pleckstrin-like domain
MENIEGREEITIKTSRIAYINNYIIAVLVIVFAILFRNTFGLTFTLLPHSLVEMGSSYLILGFFAVAAFLIEQPEWERFTKQYVITLNDVIAVEGLLTKRRIVLPYGSISEVTVNKSVFGRMLNYGDLFLGAFRTGSDIHMKGMRNASRIHEIIQNRINMIRESQIGFFGEKGTEGSEKPKEKGEVKKPEKKKNKPQNKK